MQTLSDGPANSYAFTFAQAAAGANQRFDDEEDQHDCDGEGKAVHPQFANRRGARSVAEILDGETDLGEALAYGTQREIFPMRHAGNFAQGRFIQFTENHLALAVAEQFEFVLLIE